MTGEIAKTATHLRLPIAKGSRPSRAMLRSDRPMRPALGLQHAVQKVAIMLSNKAKSVQAKDRGTSNVAPHPIEIIGEMERNDFRTRPRNPRAAFLEAFAESGSIAKAARLVGIDRTTHYDWLDKDGELQGSIPGNEIKLA